MNKLHSSFVIVLTGLIFLPSPRLFAQNDECCIVTVPVGLGGGESLSSGGISSDGPAGRSLGMGGALAAIADDASSAYANPAGPSRLIRPSIAASTGFDAEDDGFFPVLAASYPIKNWAISVFHIQLADTKNQSMNYPVGDHPSSKSDLDINAQGFAVSYIVGEHFFLGAGLTHYRMKLQNREHLNADFVYTQIADDRDFGLHAGAQWIINKKWDIGAFWREAVRFEMDVALTAPPYVERAERRAYPIPASQGVGLSYRPNWNLTFVLQADHGETAEQKDAATPVITSELLGDLLLRPKGEYQMGDTWFYRFGFEYSFWQTKLIPALRLGVRREQATGLYYVPEGNGPLDQQYRDFFPKSDGAWHYSAGFGLIPKESLAVEAAIEISPDRETFALLITKRF